MKKQMDPSEFAPYYGPYINAVPEGDIFETLHQQLEDTVKLFKNLNENQAEFRYGPNKWSIKEVFGHMTDTERIMAYRLLAIARGETLSLPGFDENEYVRHAEFDKQTLEELLEQFTIVRKSTLALLKSLSTDAWLRRGTANQHEVSVRALAFIIAGHELHHRTIISERYIQSEGFPS
ncbi:DinB family protein [Neobacillus sp. LXY-4]|uniref:DinB family protein n=1 Tax=Neobacillus sp. LXY-4 TaxID=3379826 RepID=UPI003EDEDC84